MGVAKRKLNPQELELVETYRKAGVEPVGGRSGLKKDPGVLSP